MEKKNQFTEPWDRVKEITGWRKDNELAKFLEISGSSVSGTKGRGNFPIEWAHKIALAYESSTDWILCGYWPTKKDEKTKSIAILEDPVISEVKGWLNEMNGSEPGIYIWFKVELQNKFPAFKEYCEKKRAAALVQEAKAG